MNLLTKIAEKNRDQRREKQAKDAPRASKRKEYLLNEKTAFDVTEAFRNLKASISVSVPKKNKRGVAMMVTSSYPEEGKTMVTANLSLMFALSNAKVLLIDADIRKGRVAKFFNRKSSPGLSDYLSGQVALEDVLVQSKDNENFYVITCGTHSPKPYELLESEAMTEMLEKLKDSFDYIIFDTPPVLVVPDALALAPLLDGTVLVCRHQTSYISDIAKTLNTLKFAKANVLGCVVNDFKAPKGKMYGNKSYSYYRYAYSAYETTNPEEDEE